MPQTQRPSSRWGNRGGTDPVWESKPKLLPKQRDEIVVRLEDGEDPKALAVEFGVSAATIRNYR